MKETSSSLVQFKKRWIFNAYLRIFILSLGIAIFSYLLLNDWTWGLQILLFSFILLSIRYKPWTIDLNEVIHYLDLSSTDLEFSSGLLTKSSESMSGIAQLQQHKIAKRIREIVRRKSPPISFKLPLFLCIACIVLGILANRLHVSSLFQTRTTPETKDNITFVEVDSTKEPLRVPKIVSQNLRIDYPSYTNLSSFGSDEMNVKAVEGSRLTWTIQFDTVVKQVFITSMDKDFTMEYKDGSFTKSLILENSGFYSFSFVDGQDKEYVSDLYFMERVKDNPPSIQIAGVDEFNSFEYFDTKQLDIEATIKDDYGVSEAIIIATLSRGEGEAIQFREEQLEFNSAIARGAKESTLKRSLDLDQLKMQPGDELYFHIEARDLKQPGPNIARSKTFFAVIKDTITSGFEVDGNLGADLMPDYFRSQRQLIIDTEKLIKDKPSISEKEFKFRSNELGFDQKALRLKYGQFMGDEEDSGLAINQNSEEQTVEGLTDSESESKDPLADYTHDHDSEDHQHEDQLAVDDDSEKEDPLHDYLHDHGDPESATLFEKSLKVKLRDAMNEMWDAELYLRLYEPQKSLPYQYRALRLIQEIKNSARIYVHRIGFDPPPIKEENRLTGKLENIGNYKKESESTTNDSFKYSIQAIALIEQLIQANKTLNEEELSVLIEAGDEVATLAIERPGNYLTVLQHLKWLSEGVSVSRADLESTRTSLYELASSVSYNPNSTRLFRTELNSLFLKDLSIDE